MKLIYAFLIALSVFVSIQGSLIPRVVGGKEAPIGKYAYQAFLKIYDNLECGASIINKRHVLTAAHCVYAQIPYPMTVTVGATTRRPRSGVPYYVEEIIPHEHFNRSTSRNDIALLRVSADIQFTKFVHPVELPTEDLEPGVDVKLIGWGQLGEKMPDSDVLMELDVTTISNDECKETWEKVSEINICTLTKAGKGSCIGDSGGPLVTEDNVQVGVVSYGKPCAVGVPDVYTKTYSYVDWIKKHSKLPSDE